MDKEQQKDKVKLNDWELLRNIIEEYASEYAYYASRSVIHVSMTFGQYLFGKDYK
jgi:hypothetical protein